MRWTLTAISTAWADTTKSLGLTTDVPTHLWLLWSLIPPKRFIDYPERRGTFCRIGEFLWPWPLNSLEQNEPGLTVAKSFTWGPWPEGQTRYYCFYPDPTAQIGHSTSPVFQQTAPWIPPTVFNSDRHYDDFAGAGLPMPPWDVGFFPAADPVRFANELQIPCWNIGRQEGVVIDVARNLSTSITQVFSRCLAAQWNVLLIATTKTTNSNPYGEPDLYAVFHDRFAAQFQVARQLGGVAVWLYQAAWIGADITITIEIEDGNIYFYERGILRFSEAFLLPTYNLYTYIYAEATAMGLGINYFDDFLQHRAWPT